MPKPAPAPDPTTEVEPFPGRLPDEVQFWVSHVMQEIEDTDSDAVSLDIAARVLSAKTAEEVLGGQAEAVHARDVLGVPLMVHGFKYVKGDFDNAGLGFFAVVDCEDRIAGARFPVTCGGTNVMAQLYVLRQNDLLPVVAAFTEASPTARGYRPLWLQAVGK